MIGVINKIYRKHLHELYQINSFELLFLKTSFVNKHLVENTIVEGLNLYSQHYCQAIFIVFHVRRMRFFAKWDVRVTYFLREDFPALLYRNKRGKIINGAIQIKIRPAQKEFKLLN